MMLRLFIIDWLSDYINTSRYDMTISIELLGILSMGIIAFLLLGLIVGVWLLVDFVKGKVNKK